ncbi:hypothetical protein [Bradyrhizobium nitroreducens]|uniref:hypothetical protein n=1 Tax=Bradyrhizobium nitroreducens TaxID=709803 RepID=UPI0011AE8A12|nr:hypothetical protein [Bradyrhizobium nitroreducens]
MTEQTAVILAANAQCSIGKRRDRSKRSDVRVSIASTAYRTNQANPTAFSDWETTAPTRITRAIAL